MENQIEPLARMIVERPLSNIPSNTVTLRDIEEQVMTFLMFMDDEDETVQELEECTPQEFQEPLPNASEENNEERRRLVEFKGNFNNTKRKRLLYCGKVEIIFSSIFALINLMFSFKELKLYPLEVETLKRKQKRSENDENRRHRQKKAPTADGRVTYHQRQMAFLFTNTNEKLHFDWGVNSGFDLVFGSVRGLHCTWSVPRTRASFDGVDVSDSGEWIHLKRGVDRGGCGQLVYVDTASCSAVGSAA
ncbi:hypothetical protein M9H77_36409 [Catharanthus roseus]|uniref:Uncharacterized protein n=1 Tax=Catharanthus roseus TaxID=4058 RepID=A0ACB9ZRR7_CATRO|nr:hypothetical protein M9H77_36409 [Catharanthus roseus]